MSRPRSIVSGAGWPELDAIGERSLHFAAFDMRNAFYKFPTPGWRSQYICLPQVCAEEMSVDSFEGQVLTGSELLWPHVAVAPMCCS